MFEVWSNSFGCLFICQGNAGSECTFVAGGFATWEDAMNYIANL